MMLAVICSRSGNTSVAPRSTFLLPNSCESGYDEVRELQSIVVFMLNRYREVIASFIALAATVPLLLSTSCLQRAMQPLSALAQRSLLTTG